MLDIILFGGVGAHEAEAYFKLGYNQPHVSVAQTHQYRPKTDLK